MTTISVAPCMQTPIGTRSGAIEGLIWFGFFVGFIFCTAFFMVVLTGESPNDLALSHLAINRIWYALFLVLLLGGVSTRFLGKGKIREMNSPLIRWGTLGAALVLDLLVLLFAEQQNGAMRTMASGFIRSGFWSVLLMTFSMGLHLGKAQWRKTETFICLFALLLHTFLLLRQPDVFAVALQWVSLVILAFFAVASHPLRWFLWIGAAVMGSLLFYLMTIKSYLIGRVLGWLNPEYFGFNEGYHMLKLQEAFGKAGALGVDGALLPDAVRALPADMASNGFVVLCLWLGAAGGAIYLLLMAALFCALLYFIRSLENTATRLALMGAGIMLALSQLFVVAGQFGCGPLVAGFGLAFLGAWQTQTALLALWLITLACLRSENGSVKQKIKE